MSSSAATTVSSAPAFSEMVQQYHRRQSTKASSIVAPPRADPEFAPSTSAVLSHLSMLPWGPLENAILFLKARDLAELLRVSKEFSTVHSDEFWRERCCETFGRHLANIDNLSKDAMKAMLDTERHAKWGLSRSREQLLASCLGSSTRDHMEEGPEHTLQESPCGGKIHQNSIVAGRSISISPLLGQRFQAICGCWREDKCYWSSAPSAKADKDEWIEYGMAEGLAVVTSFVICPYTSFWQPNQPTYNPVEACIQLSHPAIDEPYYESPRFRVAGTMMPQQFELPKPVVSLGGKAKLLLFGMAQRQTLGEHAGDTANHYHCCLSHVALKGAKLPMYRLESPSISDPAAPLKDTAAQLRQRVPHSEGNWENAQLEDTRVVAVDGARGMGTMVPYRSDGWAEHEAAGGDLARRFLSESKARAPGRCIRLARVVPVVVQLRVPVLCEHDDDVELTVPASYEQNKREGVNRACIVGDRAKGEGSGCVPALAVKLPCCYVKHLEWEIHVTEYTRCSVLLSFCAMSAGLAVEDVVLVDLSTGRVVPNTGSQSVADCMRSADGATPKFAMLCPKWGELDAHGVVRNTVAAR